MTNTNNAYSVDVEVVQSKIKTYFVYADTHIEAEKQALFEARSESLQGENPCYTIQRTEKLNG